MKKINFITSNKGKIKSLNTMLKDENVEIISLDLNITEPQADSVKEVSLIKAKTAFSMLNEPVIVEDGGFEIEALNDFPGVYTKYILKTLGINGILKLLEGVKNRKAKFVSCTTYIDKEGNIFQFERDGGHGLITKEPCKTKSDLAWSDIWYIFYKESLGKVLAECTEEELMNSYSQESEKSSLIKFSEWYKNR